MQTECAVCWGAEFPMAGEAEIVGAVAGSVTMARISNTITTKGRHCRGG